MSYFDLASMLAYEVRMNLSRCDAIVNDNADRSMRLIIPSGGDSLALERSNTLH